ncbi:hypothetical protein BDY24DRAFT_396908 [Mrakia frigida]|uniref:uncharacterized protein n=1 Tax=Mrakia frigida TaxID=29902 RepID=UPI003FCC2213
MDLESKTLKPSTTHSDYALQSVTPSLATATTTHLPSNRETRSQAPSASPRRRWDDLTSEELAQSIQKKPRLVLQSRNSSPSPPSSSVALGTSSNPLPSPPAGPSSLSHSSLNHVHLHFPAQPLARTSHSYNSSSSSSPSLGNPSSHRPPRPLEPLTFLQLGTPPSFCVPPSSFCWWCGCAEAVPFSTFYLAAPSPEDPSELVKIGGKLTCVGCLDWFETSMKSGGVFLVGVREMSDIQRMSWAREMLEERGKSERRRSVIG